jgi:hypothetical protein
MCWLTQVRIYRGLGQARKDVQQQTDGTNNLCQPARSSIFHAVIIASIMAADLERKLLVPLLIN